MGVSSGTGGVHKGSGEGRCCAAGRLSKHMSSCCRALIAVLQNNLLLSGSRRSVTGAGPMSDCPHESERISGLEAWAPAFATALVALIAIGIVPHVHW